MVTLIVRNQQEQPNCHFGPKAPHKQGLQIHTTVRTSGITGSFYYSKVLLSHESTNEFQSNLVVVFNGLRPVMDITFDDDEVDRKTQK